MHLTEVADRRSRSCLREVADNFREVVSLSLYGPDWSISTLHWCSTVGAHSSPGEPEQSTLRVEGVLTSKKSRRICGAKLLQTDRATLPVGSLELRTRQRSHLLGFQSLAVGLKYAGPQDLLHVQPHTVPLRVELNQCSTQKGLAQFRDYLLLALRPPPGMKVAR